MTFTHEWYEGFLRRLRSAGYEFGTFETPPRSGEVLLRHDLDLSLRRAVKVARIEAEQGVTAAYFLLLTSPLYNAMDGQSRAAIREVASLGHEVGLHFDTHQYWAADTPPSPEAVVERVREEQSVLASIVDDPLETVSFHVPPEWVLGESFPGLRSAYEPAYFEDVEYVADSGQRWRSEPPFADGRPDAAQVLTHPGLWGETDASFDARVEQAITETCTSLERRTLEEYLGEGDGR